MAPGSREKIGPHSMSVRIASNAWRRVRDQLRIRAPRGRIAPRTRRDAGARSAPSAARCRSGRLAHRRTRSRDPVIPSQRSPLRNRAAPWRRRLGPPPTACCAISCLGEQVLRPAPRSRPDPGWRSTRAGASALDDADEVEGPFAPLLPAIAADSAGPSPFQIPSTRGQTCNGAVRRRSAIRRASGWACPGRRLGLGPVSEAPEERVPCQCRHRMHRPVALHGFLQA